MERVTLPQTARQSFAERLGWKEFPDPNSEAFDHALEELREINPEVYTEVQNALEYKGEPLPVEREAKLASGRARRQAFIDRLRNRETHDGKKIPDKRKLIIIVSAATFVLFGWMTYTTGLAGLFTGGRADAQKPKDLPATATPAARAEALQEHPFGVNAPEPRFATSLDIQPGVPQAQRVATPATSADLPPNVGSAPQTQNEPQARRISAEPQESRAGSTDLPPRDPADLPPEPTDSTAAAATPPINPYAPPTATPTASGSTPANTPEVLPTSLSFESIQQADQLPTTLSAPQADTQAASTMAGVALSTNPELEAASEAAATLTPETEASTPPAATLSWDVLPAAQSETTPLAFDSSAPLPPVPAVGEPPTQVANQLARPQPQPIDLSNAVPVGTELEAELVTAVAATGAQGTLVIAKTTGGWCERQTCPDITWIGEAMYDGTDRVNITFAQAVVSGNPQDVTATAFDADRLPGILANVGDGAPTAVQDLLRGAVGGASDYLNAINTRTTTTVEDGVIVQEQAEPDLGNYLLGRAAGLLALPADQTSVVRYASLDEGQRITILYGITL